MGAPQHRVGPQSEQPAVEPDAAAPPASPECQPVPGVPTGSGTAAGQYGEPWKESGVYVLDSYLDCVANLRNRPNARARIVACVNACQGISDPAAAIAQAREALRYLIEEPPHPYFMAIDHRFDPILKHWSHTAPQDKPYLRCPRCLVEAALRALEGK